MLVFSLNITAIGLGQISVEAKGKTIREVLGLIEKDSNYRFFYNADLITIDRIVDLNMRNQNIDQILGKLLESTDFTYKLLENNLVVVTLKDKPLQLHVNGIVKDASTGEALVGVTVRVKGTTIGVSTDINGNFSVDASDPNAILIFSFIGYKTQEITLGGRISLEIRLETDMLNLQEVIVVGYGTQKRSDITGTVSSMPKERLENLPNLNIAQAIQGAVPGVMIQTSQGGAAPTEAIMIRGRNSITASNDPLIVVDGIPYGGDIRDINTNDVKSIEILKDASAAAIYGSRGANGVILITSKEGLSGKTTISYDGKVSLQSYAKLPDLMNGEEFYNFKMLREPLLMTATEQAVYDSGEWVNWLDLVTRKGFSQEHNLSISGGAGKTTFYIAGSFLGVRGIQVNDDYKRVTNRINLDTKFNDWLTIGTRTHVSFDDLSGRSPDSSPYRMNPLTRAYDDNGNLTIYPWPEDNYFANPLEPTLWDDVDKSNQVMSNNYAIINFPFIKGLSYRINTGVRFKLHDQATYRGRDGKTGLEVRGQADTKKTVSNNTVVENIVSYNKDFGKHSIFATALYSFEQSKNTQDSVSSTRFPHDFLKWYASDQAEVSTPGYTFDKTVLISQMLRVNYTYDSRYLITLTGRRDGYSGFGANTKWGIFPSLALGWNIANESFFPFKNIFNELKVRASLGLNGNQAVDAYQTITRLGAADWISSSATVPGYIPSTLGMDDLGWESSKTLNLGFDYSILKSRITGDFNIYKTNTTDLLLDRTISAVHGITSITQNIGETENKGIELTINSRNIVTTNFTWSMSGNLAIVKNKILSLYGLYDEAGNEVNDIANKWFIGQPIRVNYNYVIDGVWQLDEADEAATWGSQPGFVKFRDVNGDHILNAEDRQFIGQQDPKLLWGLTNSFSYKNFRLDFFIHGVHGVTKNDVFMSDDVYPTVRRNTINKNWWTPDNPTNDFYMNKVNAQMMAGINVEDNSSDHTDGKWFENAGFVRLKDVSLSYDIPENITRKIHLEKFKVFVTGRNLLTLTKWKGVDPELDEQRSTPLQREFVFGLNLGF